MQFSSVFYYTFSSSFEFELLKILFLDTFSCVSAIEYETKFDTYVKQQVKL
jgi:hypothetical protein